MSLIKHNIVDHLKGNNNCFIKAIEYGKSKGFAVTARRYKDGRMYVEGKREVDGGIEKVNLILHEKYKIA